jgi:thiol-disulfide isomerase/thioredoxin
MIESKWMSVVLRAAGVYNLIWGTWVVLFPAAWFQWVGMEPLNLPVIWQCLGMVIGVYGIGYWIAAANPVRHWPIVLVGLLGKLFGPLGFVYAAWNGLVPLSFGWMCLLNDVIWWVPFSAILYHSFRWNSDRGRDQLVPDMASLLRQSCSHRGLSLEALSREKPTMVVFLRHSGCTFCRRVMADLGEVREELNALPLHVVVVHMGSPLDGTTILARYNVEYWHHISDPFCVIYRGFGLQRGRFSQLFSWRVLFRGLIDALIGGHGIGKLEGDSFFLPGVFIVADGQVVYGQPAEDAAQRPNFLEIARQALKYQSRSSSRSSRVSAPVQDCNLETA